MQEHRSTDMTLCNHDLFCPRKDKQLAHSVPNCPSTISILYHRSYTHYQHMQITRSVQRKIQPTQQSTTTTMQTISITPTSTSSQEPSIVTMPIISKGVGFDMKIGIATPPLNARNEPPLSGAPPNYKPPAWPWGPGIPKLSGFDEQLSSSAAPKHPWGPGIPQYDPRAATTMEVHASSTMPMVLATNPPVMRWSSAVSHAPTTLITSMSPTPARPAETPDYLVARKFRLGGLSGLFKPKPAAPAKPASPLGPWDNYGGIPTYNDNHDKVRRGLDAHALPLNLTEGDLVARAANVSELEHPASRGDARHVMYAWGGAIGSVILVALIGTFVFWICRGPAKKKNDAEQAPLRMTERPEMYSRN